LKGELSDRGYDVTSERGGARARLSKETGLGIATISRVLDGQIPGYETQLVLSRHLGIPVETFLIRTGKATREDFLEQGSESDHSEVSSPKLLTPEEVAALAGVPEDDRPWFTTMIRRLRKSSNNGDSTAGGAAAEG
jgi:transcriptional regulator with XRE-family HTH domain